MSYDFELSCTLPASPQAVYEAWLNSAAHSAMTGGKAKASKRVGAAFSAWDGYIVGKNIELVPGARIVQSWRASDFADDDPDFDHHGHALAGRGGDAADAVASGRARRSNLI